MARPQLATVTTPPPDNSVRFQTARIADRCGGEEGVLGEFEGRLALVLVRYCDDAGERDEEGWYLERGFGPCEREGLVFESLEAAAAWMRGCFTLATA